MKTRFQLVVFLAAGLFFAARALAGPTFVGVANTYIADAGSINTLSVPGGFTADAGSFQVLSVGGTPISPSSLTNPYLGTLIADAGVIPLIAASVVDAGIVVVTPALVSNASNLQVQSTSTIALDIAGTDQAYVTSTGFRIQGTAVLYDLSQNLILEGTPGVALGANGSAITNLGVGNCTLSAGVCNAPVPGATGNSLCFAGIQGTYARDGGAFSCNAQADAGSATIFCQGAALIADPGPAPVAVHCFN